MFVLAILTLTGCDALRKAQDTLEGALEPLVVEGIVLGVEAPQGQEYADILEASPYGGTTVTLFMADGREVSDLENAPVEGAEVQLTGPLVDVVVPEVQSGLYAYTPVNGSLVYEAESTWNLEVNRVSGEDRSTSTATLLLPAAHDFSTQIPTDHATNLGFDLDFTGLEYDAALVVVMNRDGVTYSNEPTDIRAVYNFTHGSGDVGVLSIPADAFPTEDLYLVGVAGMVNTTAADLEQMNTVLSTVVMGKMRFYGINLLPAPGTE